MIDFRYHLVSIIAVFLALAVGLAVGSTALSGKAEEALSAAQRRALANNSALTKDKSELQQQVSADQEFASAAAPRLLAGLLAGEKVVLVVSPGASSSVTSGVTTALKQAGAAVTGTISLSSSFTSTSGQNEDDLSQLAQSLAARAGIPVTAAAGKLPGQQEAAQVLAASILAGTTGGLPADASQEILAGLSQGGFLSVSSGATPPDPADAAVLVAPGGAAPQASSQVVVAVAAQLRSAGNGTVLAGAEGSIGSGSVISTENAGGRGVSTVDDADTEAGQVMVAQALRELLAGKPAGEYGIGPGAAPSPAPTAAASPAVTGPAKRSA